MSLWVSQVHRLVLVDIPGNFPCMFRKVVVEDFQMEVQEECPRGYFKAVVIRNPFDRHLPLSRSLLGPLRVKPEHEFIEEPVDYLIRFEHLNEDLRYLYLVYGLTPRTFSIDSPKTPYYDSRTLKEITEWFEEDFKVFNYPTTLWYPADPLVNGVRFDLGAKLIYASYRMRGLKTSWHLELYKKHILTFNGGWEWPGGTKDTLQDFVTTFDQLIDHFDTDQVGIIPVSEDGVLANGVHRAVVAYLQQVPIQVVIQEKKRRPYDYRFFMDRLKYGYASGTPEKNRKATLSRLGLVYTDEMALEFCRQCPNLKIVTLLPRATGKKDEVAKILRSTGDVVYEKSLEINLRGLDNLVKEFYRDEPWIGGFFSPHSMGKTKQCWDSKNPRLTVYLWASNTECCVVKKKIRQLFKVGNHSVHINDTQEETLRIGSLLFNENSRQFLQKSPFKLSPNNQKLFKEHLEAQKSNSQDYCITGSFVLALYGLRESRDLDYVYHGTPLLGGDTHNKYAHLFNTSIDDIIYNPNHHFYFAGVKVASLEVIRAMKQKRGEPKDHVDIGLIDQALNCQRRIVRPEVKVLPDNQFDIHQITFYKNGLRLENFYRHNCLTSGQVNFFEASDTTINLERSIAEGLETRTYDPSNPRFVDMAKRCPGKIGCNLSHYYLYLHLLEKSPRKCHLILEDDVDMFGQ